MSPAAARITPFAAWISLMVLQGALPPAATGGLEPAWGYAVRTLIVGALLAIFWRRFDELRPGHRLRARPVVEAIACGMSVFAVWIWLGPLFRFGVESPTALVSRADGSLDPVWLAFRVAGTALVVPVMEELFWRGYVTRRAQAHGFESVAPQALGARAIAISSVLFALEHREIAAGFVAGGVYALLYRRHADLRVAVIAHAVTNGALAAYVIWRRAYGFW